MYSIYIYILIIWEKKHATNLKDTGVWMDDMSMFENFGDCPLIWGWG